MTIQERMLAELEKAENEIAEARKDGLILVQQYWVGKADSYLHLLVEFFPDEITAFKKKEIQS